MGRSIRDVGTDSFASHPRLAKQSHFADRCVFPHSPGNIYLVLNIRKPVHGMALQPFFVWRVSAVWFFLLFMGVYRFRRYFGCCMFPAYQTLATIQKTSSFRGQNISTLAFRPLLLPFFTAGRGDHVQTKSVGMERLAEEKMPRQVGWHAR